MQRTQIKSKKCRNCKSRTKHERYLTAWGVGDLVMILITGGAWIIKLLLLKPKFRCSVCGK